MTKEKRNDMNKVDKGDRRAREERIDHLLKELREILSEDNGLFDRWRAEGLLPPEDHRDRV